MPILQTTRHSSPWFVMASSRSLASGCQNPRMQPDGTPVSWDRTEDVRRAALAADGDLEVLRALVTELKGTIWRRAWALARPDHHRAEDLTQEALVAALRPAALRQYSGAAPLAGYLSVIAHRAMIAVVRTVRENSWAGRVEFAEEHHPAPLEDDPTHGEAVRRDVALRVAAVIDALPEQTATLVRLKASGAPNQEITVLLDVPIGTVKSRFARACHQLRLELDGLES